FLGKINQIPPRHSAIQIAGKRAYDLARKGHEFELKPRPVEIFSAEISQYEFPFLEMTIHCSSGTYIRSIAHDIGQMTGCGGYVEELRRLKIADLKVEEAIQLEDIDQDNWLNKAFAVEKIFTQAIWIDLSRQDYDVLARGNFVEAAKYCQNRTDNKLILARFDQQLVGVVEFTEEFTKLKFKKKFNIVISN
ncbi:hypothetical protein IT411_01890, partial [Candidatus Peregrinibacteria bacterium]|nr:hypothetical protein [Candidatus Peregrinibacteria bacterium]